MIERPHAARRVTHTATLLSLLAVGILGCGEPAPESAPGARTLVHLEDRLDAARIASAAAPEAARQDHSWSGEALAEWATLSAEEVAPLAAIGREVIEDGVRLSLWRAPTTGFQIGGGLSIQLDDLVLGDWETVLVKARSHDRFGGITVAYNVEQARDLPNPMVFFMSTDEAPPVFSDGSEQVYAIPLRPRADGSADDALESLAVVVGGPEAGAIDILEIRLVPRGAAFLEDYGTRPLARDGELRRTLFAHTPVELRYAVDVAEGSRLDFGLSADAGDEITYRIKVDAGDGVEQVLLEESINTSEAWNQHSVDLSAHAGGSVDLILEASSERDGAVALWGAPILSSTPPTDWPNVIFYVIDGGGADLMSVYGYDRPTTPFLEELAAEAVTFEHAYSNATWTQPSTVSFMTSLHHSVLGGLRRGVHSTPVPPGAVTMADHMRAGGYQTASFTSNPNAGRIIGINQGVDVMRDGPTHHHSTSSADLHDEYWKFRNSYPGGPYWAHFQTTDVHEPNDPREPYAERWISQERRQQMNRNDQQVFMKVGNLFGRSSILNFFESGIQATGIDRQEFFGARRDLYDETMVHQDDQLRALVDDLKERGEWENTILVIGADHGHPAGTFSRFGRGLIDPQPPIWQGALFDSYSTRVPMMWIWPGKIEGGRRLSEKVSMIDVLPTLLDLVGLPQPDVLQGQSLAPLLRGEEMEVRPVIFDEFRVDEESGEMIGNIEMIDGRWGASLEIAPTAEDADPTLGRHVVPIGGRWGAHHEYFPDQPRFLLYDLDADPFTKKAVNDEHPDLVERYRRLLQIQWKAHLALAQQFSGETEEVPLSPEQLEQLKSLGYIQ
jgi:arylsulfatase A-like enzyme